jgi:hypothetical protein
MVVPTPHINNKTAIVVGCVSIVRTCASLRYDGAQSLHICCVSFAQRRHSMSHQIARLVCRRSSCQRNTNTISTWGDWFFLTTLHRCRLIIVNLIHVLHQHRIVPATYVSTVTVVENCGSFKSRNNF